MGRKSKSKYTTENCSILDNILPGDLGFYIQGTLGGNSQLAPVEKPQGKSLVLGFTLNM